MTLVQDRFIPAEPTEGMDERVVCTRIEDVTHDVRSFTLARAGGAPLAFEPGQHLTVTLEMGGVQTQRCYTISSSPARAASLTITVKRVPGGPVSNWLHDHLAVGDTLHVAGPRGRFSLAQHPASRYLFLSAGSGITPGMSMLRTLHEGGAGVGRADVVFVHSARSPADIVFAGELAAIGERPGFSVSAICEDAEPGGPWQGHIGRLTLRTLLRLAPDLHDREVFACGPPGYMASVRELLAQAGVDTARCHEESFEVGAVAPPGGHESPPGATHAVELRRAGRTIGCATGESILSAARRAGLRPASMCGEGFCGTCKTSLLAGEVDMRHAGGIRPREIDRGEILICCSTPLGDVSVDA